MLSNTADSRTHGTAGSRLARLALGLSLAAAVGLPAVSPAAASTVNPIAVTQPAGPLEDYVNARSLVQLRAQGPLQTLALAIRLSGNNAAPADIQQQVSGAAEQLDRSRAILAGLQPPAELAESHSALLDAYSEYIESARQLVDATIMGDETARQERLTQIYERLIKAAQVEAQSNAKLPDQG